MIREADTAMYAAKVSGRDRVPQFTDDLRRTVDARMRLEGDLRRALAHEEVAVWYQPEIDLRDRSVRAAEALLRWRGIELAIDDFGAGYGSLTYLRRYPIDVLKIDRSFVTHITTDTQDRKLVAGMVALADRLDVAVTAEGIELPDQEQLLGDLGCAGAQGFLYSPALPIAELVDFLRR